jgi:hypothetical protein
MAELFPIPVKSVESRQHLFVPYSTGKSPTPIRELLIIHTGQLTITYPAAGIAGSMIFADVRSFLPYGDDPVINPSGKIMAQDYSQFPDPKIVVTASLGAFQSAPKSSQSFMATVEQMQVLPPIKQTALPGDPTALVLQLIVGVERGVIYRVPYQVTVRITSGKLRDPAQIDPGLLEGIEAGATWFEPGPALPQI